MDCYDEVSFYIIILESSIVFFADDKGGNRMVNSEEDKSNPIDVAVTALIVIVLCIFVVIGMVTTINWLVNTFK